MRNKISSFSKLALGSAGIVAALAISAPAYACLPGLCVSEHGALNLGGGVSGGITNFPQASGNFSTVLAAGANGQLGSAGLASGNFGVMAHGGAQAVAIPAPGAVAVNVNNANAANAAVLISSNRGGAAAFPGNAAAALALASGVSAGRGDIDADGVGDVLVNLRARGLANPHDISFTLPRTPPAGWRLVAEEYGAASAAANVRAAGRKVSARQAASQDLQAFLDTSRPGGEAQVDAYLDTVARAWQ